MEKTMKRTKLVSVLFLILVVTAAAYGAGDAQEPTVQVEATAGGQIVDLEGEHDSKFTEYRDVPQGAILDALSLRIGKAENPWQLQLNGKWLLRQDQAYRLEVKRAGSFHAGLAWNQTPHVFSNDATFLLKEGYGRHSLDPTLRGVFEATADASLAPLVLQALATTGHSTDVAYRRDDASGWLAWDLGRGFAMRLDLDRQKRSGDRRLSIGTYIRSQRAGNFDRENFTPRGLEMPETIDFRSSSAAWMGSWGGSLGSLRAGYGVSRFENRVDSLIWDNPFQITPKRTFDWSGFSQADRGNFARSQLSLPPDHTFDRWFVGGTLNLPGRTRITGEFSAATVKQDEAFLPFTTNTAVFFPGPDGILDDPNTPAQESTDDVAAAGNLALLPSRSLDGEYKTKRATLRVSSSLYRPLTLSGHWRYYDFSDDRPELQLPGYVAFGDVAFRCGIGQSFSSSNRARPGFTPCSGDGILFNEAASYTHQNYGGDAAWRIVKALSVQVSAERDVWDYDARQVDRTAEDILSATVRVMPWQWMTARLYWLDGDKEFAGDYEKGLETSGIRAFDVWDRERQRVGADLDFEIGERWTVGGSYSRGKDEYPGENEVDRDGTGALPVERVAYGLQEFNTRSTSIGATWSPMPRLSIHASLGRDDSEWESLVVTKSTLASDAVNYDPNNRWSRLQDDRTDWLNYGFKADLLPAQLTLALDYDLARYDGRQDTGNPTLEDSNPANDPNVNSAVARPFPNLSSDLHSGRASLDWTVSGKLRVALRYWYERYRLDDFSLDVVKPLMQGVIKELRAPGTFADMNVNRYLFLNSRYSDYTANVVSATLTYAF